MTELSALCFLLGALIALNDRDGPWAWFVFAGFFLSGFIKI